MKRTTHLIAVAALVAAAVLATGCMSKPPADAPQITGRITQFDAVSSDDVVATMLVVGDGEDPKPGTVDRAQVTVTSKTRVYGFDGRPIGVEALTDGVRVKVWFEGPVAESYPVQATAGAVQILE